MSHVSYFVTIRMRHISSSGPATNFFDTYDTFWKYGSTFLSKISKTTTFLVYFELVIPILGDPDSKILSSSRLESVGSRSDHFKAVHSRSISLRVLEYKWLIEKSYRKKRYTKVYKLGMFNRVAYKQLYAWNKMVNK